MGRTVKLCAGVVENSKIYIIDEVHMLSTGGVQCAVEDAGGAAGRT